MDFLKKAAAGMGGDGTSNQGQASTTQSAPSGGQGQGQGGFLGGLGDKFNSAAGGGRESEKNEDYLDKAIDAVQQYGLGQGPQDNESAFEQAKDKQIRGYIQGQLPTKEKQPHFE